MQSRVIAPVTGVAAHGHDRTSIPIYAAAWFSVAASLGFAVLFAHDISECALLAARYTARASFLFFMLVYVAGPVAVLWPGSVLARLTSHRRSLGIAFAFVTAAHLAALSINIGFYRPRSMSAILPGSIVFALAFAMAATANAAAQHRMGIWWKRMHVIGLNAILIGFINGYVGRLSKPEYFVVGLIGSTVLAAMIALRIGASFKRWSGRGVPAR